jgi:cell division protein FtsB
MIAKNKKNKKESRYQDLFFSIFLTVLFFGAVGFLIVSNYRIGQKRMEMLNKIDSLKKEIGMLEEQNKNLQAGINNATSTSFQEEKIREQGYQKPGEQNVVVVPPENKQETSTEKPKSWWEKFLEKIKF